VARRGCGHRRVAWRWSRVLVPRAPRYARFRGASPAGAHVQRVSGTSRAPPSGAQRRFATDRDRHPRPGHTDSIRFARSSRRRTTRACRPAKIDPCWVPREGEHHVEAEVNGGSVVEHSARGRPLSATATASHPELRAALKRAFAAYRRPDRDAALIRTASSRRVLSGS
jgi:hypothetical protein